MPKKPKKLPEKAIKIPPFPAKKDGWILEIEEYCDTASITPSDLIDCHRRVNKAAFAKSQGKESKIKDFTKQPKSNFSIAIRNKKCFGK